MVVKFAYLIDVDEDTIKKNILATKLIVGSEDAAMISTEFNAH